MREILFRAKRLDNGEWIYGDLLTPTDIMDVWEISENTGMGDRYEIDPETVGQYTGLKDRNGNKIFEGDIVKFNKQIGKIVFEKGAFGVGMNENIDYENIEDNVGIFSKGWNGYSGCYNDNFISLWEIMWNFDDKAGECIEVSGNIYDNFELLGEDNA